MGRRAVKHFVFPQLVSGRDRTQTQAIRLQGTPPSPCPHAQPSPPSRAWSRQDDGRSGCSAGALDAHPSKRGELVQVTGMAMSLLPLCRPPSLTGGGRKHASPPPNPEASPASRGSCIARRHPPSYTHTQNTPQPGRLAGSVGGTCDS